MSLKKLPNKLEESQDFNVKFNFSVKEMPQDDNQPEVLKIAGYGNYSGNLEDDSCICIDRVGDVVVASGMDVSNYKKNPVILLNHDREYPIGKATKVTRKNDGLYIEAEIHAGAMEDEDFYAIKSGIYTSFSIGFRIRKVEWKEIEKSPVCFITASELLECSVVTIPASPESTFQVAKSLDGDNFFAGELKKPTQQSAVTNKTQEDDKMKMKLRDLLADDKVKELEALGLTEKLEEETEVDVKAFVEAKIKQELTVFKEEIIAELKAAPAAEEKAEEEVPATPSTEVEAPAEEKEEVVEEVKEDEVDEVQLKALSEAVEKLKALI